MLGCGRGERRCAGVKKWGEVWRGWKSVRLMVSVDCAGKCVKACWDVEKCVERCGRSSHTFLHLPLTFLHPPTLTQHLSSHFPTPSHSPDHTSPHTSPYPPHSPNISLPHTPHSPDTSLHTHLTPPHTLSHFPTPSSHLPTPLPHSHLIPPSSFPRISLYTLPHNPHSPHHLQNFSILLHTYFIIYPIPKFITFLIYCQISLAIKCTSNSL